MKKPVLIVNENLLMPIRATERKIREIKDEVKSTNSVECQTGLFLMAVAFVESRHKEVLKYYLRYNPEKINSKKTIEITKNLLVENEDFHIVEGLVTEVIDKMPALVLMLTATRYIGKI